MVRVIDASVALKWFLLEAARDRALEVLEEIFAAPARFAVPELFYFELAHVFSRAVPNPSDTQKELLRQVSVLGMQRFAMTPALLAEILSLRRLGLLGYDAAYVGLARLLRGQWITFDLQAHAAVAHLGLSQAL